MEFRLAKKEELDECVRVYTEAFYPYEFSNIYRPKNDRRYYRFTKAVHRTAVNIYFKRKMLFVGVQDGRIVSCACMDAPGQSPMTVMEYIRSGAIRAAAVGGIHNLVGYAYMVEQCERHCSGIKEPHWYLCNFAVDPQFQRKGFGSRMLQEGLFDYVAQNGGGDIYLVTNSQGNSEFYTKNRFRQIFYEDLLLNKKVLGNWTLRAKIQSA